MEEHNKHEKEYTIIINGRPKKVAKAELTFDEIVALAFDNPPSGPNVVFTVTYSGAGGRGNQGTLTEGGSVEIQNGMIFNVKATDRS